MIVGSQRARHMKPDPTRRLSARKHLVGWSRSTPLPNSYYLGVAATVNALRFNAGTPRAKVE